MYSFNKKVDKRNRLNNDKHNQHNVWTKSRALSL